MSREHQLGDVVLSKEDSKGRNIETQLTKQVQALWEETHKDKGKDKKAQDHEFSAKLEILDRKLHKAGGVLSGKNAQDLHLVGVGYKNGEANLFFANKDKGQAESKNLYLVDESGKIVASSEMKERKATGWKTSQASEKDPVSKIDPDSPSDRVSGKTESPDANSTNASEQSTRRDPFRQPEPMRTSAPTKTEAVSSDNEEAAIRFRQRSSNVRDPFERKSTSKDSTTLMEEMHKDQYDAHQGMPYRF